MPPPPPPPPRPPAGKIGPKKYVRPAKKASPPRMMSGVERVHSARAMPNTRPKTSDAARKAARNRALGALIGAAIGDSIGSHMEFQHDFAHNPASKLPTPERVREALRMPGNGPPHMLAPGQVTDDTEMALALASALKGARPTDGFPAGKVRAAYHAWVLSGPFDVGVSTRGAFEHATKATINPKNESNGALMRIAPLAAWCYRLDDASIGRLARADTALSHSNGVAQLASGAYVIALCALIRGEGPAAARKRALAWLKTVRNPVSARVVTRWITAPTDPSNSDTMRSAGWLKHAVRLAFFHLKRGSTFRSAIRRTLLTGGDTDTNAAIVGAMLGARDGSSKLPPLWRRRVLTSNTSNGAHPRPALYHPHKFVAFVNAVV